MTETRSVALPSVSVVIPAYNAEATLRICLEALCAQTYSHTQTEILVVDNGSHDGTRAIIESFAPRVGYLLENKRGRSIAQNYGIAQARGEIAALIDADCIAEPQWLEQLMEPFPDETVGIVGGPIRSVPTTNPFELFGDKIHNQELSICRYKPPYVSTANWASSRRLLIELGGFDETLERGLDVDMAWRIVQTGKGLVYQPDAVIHHHNERTARAWFRAGYGHGYSSVFLIRKHQTFLQSYGHKRFNPKSYLLVLASLRNYLTTGSTEALCNFTFNAGKKLGKLVGSVRAGYMEL